ncbi:MAG TPA: hypothetical protein VF637_11395 [Sphingomicrobium sp.]
MIRAAAFFIGASLLGLATPLPAQNAQVTRGEQQLSKLVADRIPGKPVGCIRLRNIRSSRVLDGTAIVYESLGGRLYVNRPEVGAQTLRSDDILLTKTPSGELCSVDIVRLIDQGSRFEHGFVGLNQFVPYDPPEKKRSS